VREEMGLINLKVMIPFCRTPQEGQKVLDEMAKNGLVRTKKSNGRLSSLLGKITGNGSNGNGNGLKEELEVWVMAEIPSNILQVEEFGKIFDGFSIGSNDLTQLTLGLDRDSKLVAHIANERNESVKSLIRTLIKKAHAMNLKVGICGQGPSDFPDFAEFLVKEGIDSISINPDTVLKATINIREVEDAMKKKVRG
jgi:pyruvate, water dikinase